MANKKENQIIGTDVSLKVCKEEGYLQLEKNGKFNPKQGYKLFSYYPQYILERAKGMIDNEALVTNVFISLQAVLSIYKKHKEKIDKFCGLEFSMDENTYNYSSFLSLADDVNMYCGLE